MIRYLLLDNNLTRQLKYLRQAGGTARVAADHAEAIIQQWVTGEVKSPKQLTRGTRYGEARIKNCLKYDLVEAYRLLTVMDEDRLIFLFPGTHDECDQWIDHNIGWRPRVEKRGSKVLSVQQATLRAADEDVELDEDPSADDCFPREIDERDLRIIFSGICRTNADQKQA